MSGLIAPLVYTLCFLASSACAFLLARGYARTKTPLLWWSAICFAFLGASNLVLVMDLLILPTIDLSIARSLLALAGVAALLFSFIWQVEEGA